MYRQMDYVRLVNEKLKKLFIIDIIKYFRLNALVLPLMNS